MKGKFPSIYLLITPQYSHAKMGKMLITSYKKTSSLSTPVHMEEKESEDEEKTKKPEAEDNGTESTLLVHENVGSESESVGHLIRQKFYLSLQRLVQLLKEAIRQRNHPLQILKYIIFHVGYVCCLMIILSGEIITTSVG